ncbi:MAG: hypothetical protein JNK67_21185 [Alphaproteobacteria bacterium]|nr:hypothetical protein [Alphaproteobacteria bacterium]
MGLIDTRLPVALLAALLASLIAALVVAPAGHAGAQARDIDCPSFPEPRLTGIVRLADRSVVTWQSGARNTCRRPIRVAATLWLLDSGGTRIAERRVELDLAGDEGLELRGDFVVPALAMPAALGGIVVDVGVR